LDGDSADFDLHERSGSRDIRVTQVCPAKPHMLRLGAA
jgi:hypothetical protein